MKVTYALCSNTQSPGLEQGAPQQWLPVLAMCCDMPLPCRTPSDPRAQPALFGSLQSSWARGCGINVAVGF